MYIRAFFRLFLLDMCCCSPPSNHSVVATTTTVVVGLQLLYRNAQVRLELRESLRALPSDSEQVYAPGTQKTNVKGEVMRWNLKEEAVEALDAREYIAGLEAELASLKQELARVGAQGDGSSSTNELLAYLKGLEPQNLAELTSMANDDVLEAMNSFVRRLIESQGDAIETDASSAVSESTAAELGKLLFWLMVVGYSLRSLGTCLPASVHAKYIFTLPRSTNPSIDITD